CLTRRSYPWALPSVATQSPLRLRLARQAPFLSHCAGAHPALRSFPTRRSSDLAHLVARGGQCVLQALQLAPHPGCRDVAFAYPRSEEHTSELQSRENLVCRLLLEKKKMQIGCDAAHNRDALDEARRLRPRPCRV